MSKLQTCPCSSKAVCVRTLLQSSVSESVSHADVGLIKLQLHSSAEAALSGDQGASELLKHMQSMSSSCITADGQGWRVRSILYFFQLHRDNLQLLPAAPLCCAQGSLLTYCTASSADTACCTDC